MTQEGHNSPRLFVLRNLVICRDTLISQRPRRRHQRLFATAKLNGFDPARWLADTMERLPTCPNSKIDSLLPFANSMRTQTLVESGRAGRLQYCAKHFGRGIVELPWYSTARCRQRCTSQPESKPTSKEIDLLARLPR